MFVRKGFNSAAAAAAAADNELVEINQKETPMSK